MRGGRDHGLQEECNRAIDWDYDTRWEGSDEYMWEPTESFKNNGDKNLVRFRKEDSLESVEASRAHGRVGKAGDEMKQ